MRRKSIIKNIGFYEILDTRGKKTIEAWIKTNRGIFYASSPVGTSSGKYEVPSFPRGWKQKAKEYLRKLIGKDLNMVDVYLMDWKYEIGSTLSTAVSLAALKARAGNNLIKYLKDICEQKECNHKNVSVTPIGKVVGGGKHSRFGPEIQEFLLIPKAKSFADGAFLNAELYMKIGEELADRDPGFRYGRDYESGWITSLSNEEVLEVIKEVVPKKVRIGVDMAASSYYKKGQYVYHNMKLHREEQIEYVSQLIKDFNLFYIEDPFYDDDFESFSELTKKHGKKRLIVGDDLFVTNIKRLEQGIKIKAGNSIIIKPNQIGTFMETLTVMEFAFNNRYTPILSHRSGETDDNVLAKIAFGFGIPYFKCGVVGERVVKINEVIREEKLWQQ